ncbi:hypothetical protein AMBLS11_13725 [Alteromonas macleodii str. 'Black Sea 11']|nr:hypothetical protein AMBLS11_13725 [Alteromonas macleodii str. 'Black Sea 11']
MEVTKTRFVLQLKPDISKDKGRIEALLNRLAYIGGVYRKDITDVSVKKGCTLIDGSMDKAALERLAEFYETLKAQGANNIELKELENIINQFEIEALVFDPESKHSCPSPLPKGNKKAIVLVHGWGGDIEKTFGNLPSFLSNELKAEVLAYPYPSGWLQQSPSIAFIARNLDNWTRNHCPNYEVGIIGHSLGGLITRYLVIIQQHRRNALNVRHITLAASPSNGSHFATIGAKIPCLRSTQIEELRPNSSFLIDLNERWIWWSKEHIPESCALTTFYAYDDEVVNFTSAIGGDTEAIPIFNENHTSIVKPQSINCDFVMTIVRAAKSVGLGS